MQPEDVLRELRGTRLISIQDYDRIQPIDRGGWAQVDVPVTEYDRAYPARLKEYLGIDLVIVRSEELLREIGRVARQEAEKIADGWIEEALEMKNVTREDVVRSAEVYVAYKRLLEKYEAAAITGSSWALIPEGKLKAMPPLAEMELAKELIPCCCESLVDCTVTQMIGTYLSGRPAMVGDVLNEWQGLSPIDTPPENLIVVGHCYGPVNPHGDDRVPYIIRDHVVYESPVAQGWMQSWRPSSQARAYKQLQDEHITLIGITVKWPVGEPATVVKFDVYDRKVSILTGTVRDGNAIFKDFDDSLCRTKIAVETTTSFENVLGGHQVVFYGDLTAGFKAFADLAGFEVVGGN